MSRILLPCRDRWRESLSLALLLLLLPSILRAECTGCHGALLRGSVRHAPLSEGCAPCHAPIPQKSHPQEAGSMGRGKGIPAVCIDCHTADVMRGAFVHRPISEGKCGSCHDPHTSDHPSLLKADAPTLCRRCHAGAFKYPVVHRPVATGECIACHDPHAAGSRHLLRAFSSDLCFRCHEQSRFEGISVHQPVDDGDCGVCHLPHGSANPRLLAKAYPTERYLPFSEERFALCFECHDPALVTDQLTLSSTRFRNGDQNLHHLHVMLNQRGRSCSACHDVHASLQQHLVTTQATGFGSWVIPLDYTMTDTGGTCVVGCHKPRGYDRVVYVENR